MRLKIKRSESVLFSPPELRGCIVAGKMHGRAHQARASLIETVYFVTRTFLPSAFQIFLSRAKRDRCLLRGSIAVPSARSSLFYARVYDARIFQRDASSSYVDTPRTRNPHPLRAPHVYTRRDVYSGERKRKEKRKKRGEKKKEKRKETRERVTEPRRRRSCRGTIYISICIYTYMYWSGPIGAYRCARIRRAGMRGGTARVDNTAAFPACIARRSSLKISQPHGRDGEKRHFSAALRRLVRATSSQR